MALFSDLVPEVRPMVQKAPIPIIKTALVQATRELCREAFCYRLTVPRMSPVAGQADYIPLLPAGTRIVKILSTDYPTELTVRDAADLDLTMPDWRVTPGYPRHVLLKDGQTVSLAPAPGEGATAQFGLMLALEPTRTATTIDDEFLEQCAEYIMHGAISKLTLQAGQEWYAPDVGDMYRIMFAEDKLTAAANSRHDNNAKVRPMTYGGL